MMGATRTAKCFGGYVGGVGDIRRRRRILYLDTCRLGAKKLVKTRT